MSSWNMKKKNGLSAMKDGGKEYGVMPVDVAAAAVVPVSSTSITALCSIYKQPYMTILVIMSLEVKILYIIH